MSNILTEGDWVVTAETRQVQSASREGDEPNEHDRASYAATPCTCCVTRQELVPIYTNKKKLAKDWKDSFLTSNLLKLSLQPNIVYTENGKPKFLLLRNCISQAVYEKTLESLGRIKFQGSNRENQVAQRLGGDRLYGWYGKYNPRHPDKLTATSRKEWAEFVGLWEMLREMHNNLETHLVDYFRFHDKMAWSLERPAAERLLSLDKVRNPKIRERIAAEIDGEDGGWNPSRLSYLVWATSFSTVTVNKTLVFKAHQDKNNVKGTLGCLVALGEFAGGTLLFPRFGVGANVGPLDMLICDSNEEFHGNLGPVIGTRYSIVAYLHRSLRREKT